MPKDKSSRSLSNKSHELFYKPYSRENKNNELLQKQQEEEEFHKWDDVTCSICMESPHNAVLLMCGSHDKGCRPFMCDTSYRHSNCLDQYIKSHSKNNKNNSSSEQQQQQQQHHQQQHYQHQQQQQQQQHHRFSPGPSRVRTRELSDLMRSIPERQPIPERLPVTGSRREYSLAAAAAAADVPAEEAIGGCDSTEELVCPLCRGKVGGWKVIESVRKHLNRKRRSCAQDSCGYVGGYEELRKHARCVHPLARPSEIDPVRQQDWWRMEQQRDYGDVLSAMPGATIVGDYVIDEEEEDSDRSGDDEIGHQSMQDRAVEEHWTMLLLFHVGGRGYRGRNAELNSSGGGGGGGGGGGSGGIERRYSRASDYQRQSLWDERGDPSRGGSADMRRRRRSSRR